MEMPELLDKMLQGIISENEDSTVSRRDKEILNKLEQGQWRTALDSVISSIGLIPMDPDPYAYTDKRKLVFLLVYVDGILIKSDDRKWENEIKKLN